jgi:DNA polymerase III subunit gamma/tau
MPYEVLARKWRPQVFRDVAGQEHVTQTLINAIRSERLAHAYLFSGPRGVGKTSVARILAKAINCEKGEPGNPCNACPSCVEITKGSSVDVQEIDGASNRGIDEIRDLREYVKYMPSASKYRIYIIDEVHMLTLPAFNALLKTLEEPPAHVKFIFATTETHKVPVTILSRCQRFDFKRIPLTETMDYLERVTKEEGIDISRDGLALIARAAEGSMRDAESLLDQVISFAGSKVEDIHVTDILGVFDKRIIFETSRALIEGSPGKCLDIVDTVYNNGYDVKDFYRSLMHQFRNLLISLIAPEAHLLDLTENDRQETRNQAEAAGSEKLQAMLNLLIHREEDLRFTSHPRLVLETILIKLCQMGEFLSFADLLGKMESLEKRLLENLSEGNTAPADRLSDPGAPWASNAPAEQEEEKKAPGTGADWNGFLTFLSSKNKRMFKILEGWKFLGRTGKTFEIEKDHQAFSSSYFEDPVNLKVLLNTCREFFGEEIHLSIKGNSSPKEKETNGEGRSRGISKNGYADLPPPVQDVLQIFQGEIRETCPPQEQGDSAQKKVK